MAARRTENKGTAGEKVVEFIKEWMLPLAMVLGAGSYLIFHFTPALHPIGPACHSIVSNGQPLLISIMLFLQFVKTSPRDMLLHRWHLWLLLFQAGTFTLCALAASRMDRGAARILMECAMLCLVCPTAAAAGVITEKLGGSLQQTITYVVLINALSCILIPGVVPLVHPSPEGGATFWGDVGRIALRVFPMLLLPCLLAWTIRYLFPRLHTFLLRYAHWSFYIWGFGLTFALILATRALVTSDLGTGLIAGIIGVSALCCAAQFFAGRKFASRYGRSIKVTAGQALGQKNTGFLIWLGYNFMTPVTSIAGGLYAIFQNLFNSWELYEKRKEDE